MPPLVAAAAITAGGAIAGGAMQSRAQGKAADKQTEAANRAAEIEAQSNRETLQFQREQAQHAWREAETARRANYDQWRAREGRLGSVGEMLGYGGRQIPDYVPSGDPGFLPPGGPPSGPQPRPPTAPPGSVDDYVRRPPVMRARPVPPMTAALRMPDPYAPRSVGAYL